MKARKVKKSTTFKTHFFSALCRSIFTNTSLIFVNSVFVKSVGGKSYSQLFFFASTASLIYYLHFAFRGEKQGFTLYKIVIALTLVASILCFLEPFVAALEPYNNILLYVFAVSVVVVDLIGTTLGPVVLQLSVNPAIFKEVYQKIVTAELLARIAAAAFIWILSMNHWLGHWYYLGWGTLIGHFFLFNVMLTRLSRIERKSKIKVESANVFSKVGKALKFVFSNPMVRLAMSIMIWSQLTKFVVECLFYQAADTTFSSARKIASFVSVTTMVMIVLSLLSQQLVGKKLTQRLQLSTLLTFQPVNVLVFSGLALILPPFWPVVILLVTYNLVNRIIQLPVSRQCLVPVPRSQRSTIVSLICIFMSGTTMIVSGVIAALKNILHFQDFVVVLLVLGAVICFLITGLDSYYIRNLWSFYKESRSGRWQDEPVGDNLSPMELESAGSLEESEYRSTADLKSHNVLETYAISNDPTELEKATRDHKLLLKSEDSHTVLLGLKICFITGFPWFHPILTRALKHDKEEVRDFARLALQVNSEYMGIEGYSSVFVRRIKGLTLDFLMSATQFDYAGKLKQLLNIPDRQAAESLVAALTNARFKEQQEILLDCIDESSDRLSLNPVVLRMYESDYQKGHDLRELLESLSFGRNSAELFQAIESNLASLNKEKLALWSDPPYASRDSVEMQRFMHTLFAEEYRLCPQELDRTLTDTISELPTLAPEDSAILIDMHLEFLKRSELFRSWRALMT